KEQCGLRAAPAARRRRPSLDATDGATAPRGAKRANWILTVGLVLTSYRRDSANPGGCVPIHGSLRARRWCVPERSIRTGMFKTMTPRTQDRAVRRRPHVGGDHGSSTRSPAIGTDQRRQSAHRAGGTRTETDPHGPSDPRFAYLTRSFD